MLRFLTAGESHGKALVTIIEGMPAGTIGVEAVGKVTEDVYRDMLVPAVTAALDSKAKAWLAEPAG